MPEPPIEIEPMTYALRETRSLPAHALAALIAQKVALTALAALGLSKDPFHARCLSSHRPCSPCVTSLRHSHQDSRQAADALSIMPTAELPIAARRANSGWHCVTSRLLLGND